MNSRAETQPQTFAGFDGHGTFLSLFHGFTAEWVGHRQTVIAIVPPTGTKVRPVCEQCNADRLSIYSARVIAPLSGQSPGGARSLQSCAGSDQAALFLSDRGGNAGPESHLLLIPKYN